MVTDMEQQVGKIEYDIPALARAAACQALNAKTLSERAGITHPTAAKIFRGQRISATTVGKVASALGVEVADLVIGPYASRRRRRSSRRSPAASNRERSE